MQKKEVFIPLLSMGLSVCPLCVVCTPVSLMPSPARLSPHTRDTHKVSLFSVSTNHTGFLFSTLHDLDKWYLLFTFWNFKWYRSNTYRRIDEMWMCACAWNHSTLHFLFCRPLASMCHLSNCQARVRSPKVHSPKVKTKRTWADTKITWAIHPPPTTPPITFKHEGVLR